MRTIRKQSPARAAKARGGLAWERSLSPKEMLVAKRICKDATFAEDIVKAGLQDTRFEHSIVSARLSLDTLPGSVPEREMITTLDSLAMALDEAASSLMELPIQARSCIIFPEMSLLPEDIALTLQVMAERARGRAKRMKPTSEQPPDNRLMHAVSEVATICEKYGLPFSATDGHALALLELILGPEISEYQMKCSLAHFKVKGKVQTLKT